MQSKSKYMISTCIAKQPWQLDSIRVKSGNRERGIHRKQREKRSQNSLATVTTRLSAWEGMTLPLRLMITAPLLRGHTATTKNSPSKSSCISGSTDNTHQWSGEPQTALTAAPAKTWSFAPSLLSSQP